MVFLAGKYFLRFSESPVQLITFSFFIEYVQSKYRYRYQVPNADSNFILFHCINFHCICEHFVRNLIFLFLNARDVLIKQTRLSLVLCSEFCV